MSTRQEQLKQALATARRVHADNPSHATHAEMRKASDDLTSWLDKLTTLQASFRNALSLTAKAEIRAMIEKHHEPVNTDVKLVDTAGVLRLDMNGHRVHMKHEQGLELFLQLATVLREYIGCGEVECDYDPDDEVRVSHDREGRCAEIQLVEGYGLDHLERDLMVNLSAEKAVSVAVELAAVAVEVKHHE